jgi:hypothetical protein
MKFTALLRHLTVDLLRESSHSLKRKAAPGVDRMRWQEYESAWRIGSSYSTDGFIAERIERCLRENCTYRKKMDGNVH